MKNIILLFILIAFNFSNLSAQWEKSSFQAMSNLNGIDFPTIDAAYATDNYGALYKSIDAGQSWENIYEFGVFSSLTSPKFMNADTGFVIANGGAQRTFDGGLTWTSISKSWLPDTNGPSINKVKLIDDYIYSSSAENDTVVFIRSDDYGNSWDTLFLKVETNAKAYFYSMIDDQNGYFVNPNQLEKVYKTNDGGYTFSDTLNITNGPMIPQSKYDFKDSEHGYWYGPGVNISYPTRTWNDGTFYFPINLDGFGVLPVYDLDFNTSKVYASSLYGKIFYSENNGQSWVEETAPDEGPIYEISFCEAGKGLAISGNYVLIYNPEGTVNNENVSNANSSISMYPNPASNFLYIEKGKSEVYSIKMINTTGQIIKTYDSQSLDDHIIKIQLSDVSTGTYFFHLNTDKGRVIKKVIIE